VNEPVSITLMMVLAKVVTPLRVAPPVTANDPAPRRKPPPTAAPLNVRVWPAGTDKAPALSVNGRAVDVVAVNDSVPRPLTVTGAVAAPRLPSNGTWRTPCCTVVPPT